MTDYEQGDVLTLRSGNVWIVRDVRSTDDRISVGLMDPDDPNHGTAFYADRLYYENLVVLHRRGSLPQERYTTSVRDQGCFVYDAVKQVLALGGRRFDETTANLRAGELNAEWQQRVLTRI